MDHKYFGIPDSKFETFDFQNLDFKELDEALKLGVEEAKHNTTKIASSSDPATFENTILALETSDENLDGALSILFPLFSGHTNDEVQSLVEKYSPILSDYSNEVLLNADLFKRVKSVYDAEKTKKTLNTEQTMLLDKNYRSFVKNGANLSDEDKEKLIKIDSELSTLSPRFSKNVLSATNAFSWTTTDIADLSGLPESALEAAKADAKQAGEPEGTYLFSLQFPSLIPMLKYNSNREIREKFFRANSTKAVDGEFSNQKNILDVVRLRNDKALLLGFKTYAEFVLSDRMAKTPKDVFAFIEDLKKHSLDKAKAEVEEVFEFAKETDGLSDFKPWDMSYYSEKLRQKKYSISDEETKPYFSLENVLDGAFTHAEKLYGVSFVETSEVSKYQEDVRTFEVKDENGLIGVFYTDFFPRASKKPGAWCTGFRSQGLLQNETRRPHVSIVCNFSKPTKDKPSLLTYDEVRTLFHEFGHALHSLLSQCTYRSLSGTSVYWDFVELPSQIMENWTLEEESLKLFARHYKTDEVIPAALVQKLKAAQAFQTGYSCVRQLKFATLDMKWHTTDPKEIKGVLDFESNATKELDLLESTEGTSMSCSFGHIFAGGYAAGYYSYKWAEVLDADAFEYFQEKGVFNKEVATAFKENILEKGGTEHPEELYIKFRGRKPSVDALLKRDQLI
jgi:peptidyl-dipeptidase Dcp